MEPSVTQQTEYGCAVACFAYVCHMTFEEALVFLGQNYSVKHGWRPSDLVAALNRYGFSYENKYVRKIQDEIFSNNTIVLIERSASYPVGHYLALNDAGWMDPWINMPKNKELAKAKSGFRKRLPGKAMYALTPCESVYKSYLYE